MEFDCFDYFTHKVGINPDFCLSGCTAAMGAHLGAAGTAGLIEMLDYHSGVAGVDGLKGHSFCFTFVTAFK